MGAATDVVSMVLLGVLGTGHCLGMCGPLVLALPGSSKGLVVHISYHLGRVTTYVLLGGLLAGLGAWLRDMAGSGDDPLGTVARLQVIISLVSALLLLALGLVRLGIVREPAILSVATPSKVPGFRSIQERAIGGGSPVFVFMLGLLLGLLPCGLSYAAFARVLSASDALDGAMLVAAFGLGTVPGLLILGTGGAALARRHRRLADLLAGVLLIGMAISIGVDAVQALR